MFLVFDKQKICTYMISILTVVTLFSIAVINDKDNIIAVSAEMNKKIPINKIGSEGGVVGFTINITESNKENLDKVNKFLNENNIQGTIFISNKILEKFPDKLLEFIKNGNEIGSYIEIKEDGKRLSYEECVEKLRKENDTIEHLIGKKSKVYRTSLKKSNDIILSAGENEGYFCIGGEEKVLDNKEINSGDIIIINEKDILNRSEDVKELLEKLNKKGLMVKKVSESL